MKMFSHVLKRVIFDTVQNSTKSFSTSCQRDSKVTVIGAAGGVGQPLSLLLKLNSLVTHLSLYDVVPLTCGVATDLSHINTPATVSGHKDPELHSALQCANLVIMAAGVPRKPGMTRDDLFNTNASIVANASACVAQVCPKAIVAIITNPLNSMVPVACEVLRKAGVYDPKRVLGVTTLDLVRASTFVGQINKVNPESINVPVIGGHSGITIVPVLSQSNPLLQLADRGQILALIKRIQEAGTEVVQAKAGGGSATLSTAFAAARISCAILRGLRGDPNVIDSAYVESKLCKATEYFASALLFGKNGVEKNLPYGTLNEVEQGLLELAIPELVKNIKKGKEFITKQKH